MTVAQIGISIVLRKIGNSQHVTLVSCLAISFSVFIALISNSDSMSNDLLHAQLLHKCGLELMNLYNQMCASISNETSSFVEKYDKIMNDCSVNHDPVDYNWLCFK
jgi:hypothetical protein